ncbi:ROK family protein [Endozoicomonas sp. Mp262]|uniref:ROK family protein n=1 Tax=Endozoicomonas sp. Mp262 TaxID=2919499 RepID=UPI0021DAD12D
MLYGLDIGGTKIELTAFEDNNNVFTKRIPTPTESYTDFKAAIKQLVTDTDLELNSRGTVGIGIPGFIEPHTGKARCANIPCANDKLLQCDLEMILDRSVKIENDANCFVLSEARGGAAEGFSSAFGVILGTGCGGGFYLNNKLYTGCNNLAGEWGHTPLPYSIFELAGQNFPIVKCGCGLKGCIDNYLSGRGLELIYRYLTDEDKKGKEIVQSYRRHAPDAAKAVEIYCELLANGLGGIINTFDPGVIVFGGGLSNFDELYELIPSMLKQHTLKTSKLPEIRKAVFGDAGGARGAALLNH